MSYVAVLFSVSGIGRHDFFLYGLKVIKDVVMTIISFVISSSGAMVILHGFCKISA